MRETYNLIDTSGRARGAFGIGKRKITLEGGEALSSPYIEGISRRHLKHEIDLIHKGKSEVHFMNRKKYMTVFYEQNNQESERRDHPSEIFI